MKNNKKNTANKNTNNITKLQYTKKKQNENEETKKRKT